MSDKIVKYDLQAEDSFTPTFDSLDSKLGATEMAMKGLGASSNAWELAWTNATTRLGDMLSKAVDGAKSLGSQIDDQYKSIEDKSKIAATAISVAIGVILAGTLLGALYAAYKVVKETTGFIVGLLTGDSYKNQYAEDLVKATKANEELAKSQSLTTASASALNEALAWTGKTVTDVADVTDKQLSEAMMRLEEYHLVLGPGQVKAAEEFATATREFEHNAELTSQGFKRAIGDAVLPMLADLADFFKDGWPGVVTAFRVGVATMATIAEGFVNGVFLIAEPIMAIMSSVSTSMVTVAKAAWQALSGDFLGAKKTLDEGREEIGKMWADTMDGMAERSQRTWDRITMAWGADDKGPVGALEKAADGLSKEMEALLNRLENNAEQVNETFWKELKSLKEAFDDDLISEERYVKAVEQLTLKTAYGAEQTRLRTEAERKWQELLKSSDDEVQRTKDFVAAKQQELGMARKLTDAEKMLSDAQAGKWDKLLPKVKAGKIAAAEQAIAWEALARQQKYALAALEAYTAAQQTADILHEQSLDIARNFEVQYKREADDLIFQMSLYDKTQLQIQQLTATRRIDLQVRQALASLPEDANGGIDAEAAKRILAAGKAAKDSVPNLLAQNDALRSQTRLWDDVSTAAGNFFGDLIVNGKSAFDRLKQSLKSLLQDMIAFFAKRWVLQLVAGGSATFGGTAANAAGGLLTGGGGSVLGNVFNAGSSLFAAGGIYGSAGAYGAALGTTSIGAGSQAAMLAAQTGEFGASGLALTGEAAGTITGSITSALAAIPVWGWIAVAALAAYAAFGGKGGGAKTGGSFQGSFDSAGALTSTDATPLFGLKPSEAVASGPVGDIAKATASSYYALVKRFGGSAQSLSFGLGFDSDPRGTANNRVMGYVRDASGNLLFNERDREIGRDEKDITPELQLTAERALVAALQASDLEADVAKLFKGIDASKMTQEQFDDLIAKAKELDAVINGLSAINLKNFDLTALKKFQQEGESISQTFERVSGVYAQFVNDFTTDSERMNESTTQLNSVWKDLGVQAPTTLKGYRDIVQGLDLSTDAGQEFFARLMALAPAFKNVTQAVASMISTIQSNISQIYGGQYGVTFARQTFDAAANAWNSYGAAHLGWGPVTAQQTFEDLMAGRNGQALSDLVNNPNSSPELISLAQGLTSTFLALQAAMNNAANSTSGATSTINDYANAAATLANAKSDLASNLRGSLLSDLSPLSLDEKYRRAQAEVDRLYALGPNNADAVAAFGGARDTFLELSNRLYGFTPRYNEDYFRTFDEGNALSGNTVTRPMTAADAQQQTAQIIAALTSLTQVGANQNLQLAQLLELLRAGINVNDPRVVKLLQDLNGGAAGGAVLPERNTV